jgi:pimeloyl-ACP methyl ester carboxylesterase
MTAVRRVAPALACLALISGCGASRQAADRAATPAARATTGSPAATPAAELDNCFGPARGRVESVPDAGGGSLTLGVIGTGSRAVLLSNESDEDLCSWLPFAARLAASGYRAVVWDYGGNPPADEIAGLVRRLRAAGAGRVVLMGASEGAKASLIAGSKLSPAVQGVVSLSAEPVLSPGIMVLSYVRQLRCPLLLVTANQDPYGSAQAARQFLAAARSQRKELVRVPGTAHGTALLGGRSATATVPAILAFLRRVLK